MTTKRKFSSYGPVSKTSEYYAPREELVQKAITQLTGENPDEGGHYFTVWAPRQAGKSWSLREALWQLQQDDRFYTVKVNLQFLAGRIINSGSTKPVGRIICSTIWEELFSSYLAGVAEVKINWFIFPSNSENLSGRLS